MRINAIPADLMPRAVAFDAAVHALRGKLLAALSGSSAASPVEVEKLYPLGAVDQVQACLMDLHRSGEAQCCMITSRKAERSVWWLAGNVSARADWYGIREGRKPAPAQPKPEVKSPAKRVVRRMSALSTELKDMICAQPGLTLPEVYERSSRQAAEYHRIRVAICSLVNLGYVRTEGVKRHYRYFPAESA